MTTSERPENNTFSEQLGVDRRYAERFELLRTLIGAMLSNPHGVGLLPAHTTEMLLAEGYSKPRTVSGRDAIARLGTGTICRNRHNEVVQIDHGPHGEWTGGRTLLHSIGWQLTLDEYFECGSGLDLSVLYVPGASK
ncbi:hypothetical protein [Rhodococcus erythropolis]|uniref:hypothetical protein n=1 Tax=Rhodococcus erythropolis TaxID=1833 RepID=UPI001BEAC15A|nr:hypothetical protein [Rhodococcus erythropolis]MBT2268802.1 hypothetical protein [Rhodococcus erythropolis]